MFLITISVILMAEIFLQTLVRPTQTACAFTKNTSIQHKMNLLDGHGGCGAWGIKATVTMTYQQLVDC